MLDAWRIPKMPPGRLFEFGCGPGRYLQWMAHQGWKVEGLEMSPAAAATARSLGFSVHTGTLETALAPAEPYDLNVGWMVVEHLHHPVQSLRQLAERTRLGGWLAISVPNMASREASFFRESWYALEVPRHLYHFTPRTIRLLLEKAGWNVQRILHQRSLDNAIASCGFLLEDRAASSSARWVARQLIDFPSNVPLHFAAYPILFPVTCVLAAFGQTGRMTILARKSP
jgi:2-polyprenyl-3-methyl-5-hydroxy-6-metoxy-1,4-benzoquinol methylase